VNLPISCDTERPNFIEAFDASLAASISMPSTGSDKDWSSVICPTFWKSGAGIDSRALSPALTVIEQASPNASAIDIFVLIAASAY
jgi:hypothetical protein